MQSIPDCPLRSGLSERVKEARKLYIDAVAGLDRIQPTEDDSANVRAESARVVYFEARLSLREHEKQHGCGFELRATVKLISEQKKEQGRTLLLTNRHARRETASITSMNGPDLK